jgi:hypothetical protein
MIEKIWPLLFSSSFIFCTVSETVASIFVMP